MELYINYKSRTGDEEIKCCMGHRKFHPKWSLILSGKQEISRQTAPFCEYTKKHLIAYILWVNGMVCELYVK